MPHVMQNNSTVIGGNLNDLVLASFLLPKKEPTSDRDLNLEIKCTVLFRETRKKNMIDPQ